MMNRLNRNTEEGRTRGLWNRATALFCAVVMLLSSCGSALAAQNNEHPDKVVSDPIIAPIPAPSLMPAKTQEPEPTPVPAEEENPGEEIPAEENPSSEESPSEETPSGEVPAEETSETDAPAEEPVFEAGHLTAAGDGWNAVLYYPAEAMIPADAVLTLTELKGSDLYTRMKTAAMLLKNDKDSPWHRELDNSGDHFYTAAVTDAEGNQIRPQAEVTLAYQNENHNADCVYFSIGEESRLLEDDNGSLRLKVYHGESFGYGTVHQVQVGTVQLVHQAWDYMVTASYGPEAGLPAGTELKVREIMPGTPEYAVYSGMTDEALSEDWSEITLERYFDISYVSNGEKIEPQANVDVQIVFRDKIELTEEQNVQTVQIAENEATVIESDTDSTKAARHDDEAIDTVAFASDVSAVSGVVQLTRITQKIMAADGNTYEIEVSYGPEAEIPAGAEVRVAEIPEGSDLWEAYRKQTAAALNADDVRLPGLYDISIVDAEGNSVEPKASVNVAIKLANAENTAEDLHVVHFTEELPQSLVEAEQQATEQTEVQPMAEEDRIASETITASVEGDTVNFDTESFSVYAFAYKVNFEYMGVDYEMLGNSEILLSKLLDVLQTGVDINSVTSVSYTGTAMELSESEDGDWLIKVIPNAEEQSVLTVRTADKIIEITVAATGKESLDLGDAVISAANGVYLPDDAEGHIISDDENEEVISLVQENHDPETQQVTSDTTEEEASQPVVSETYYQVYDISLENVDTENYESGFQVDMKLSQEIRSDNVHLYHVHGDQVSEITDFELKDNSLSFVTENFSYFVISYTVDFHYQDEEGNTYEWSYPGRGKYALTDVLEAAQISGTPESASLRLVEGEEHPGALYLTEEDNAWYLNSDIAFTDTYELKVTVDGKVYVLQVTDDISNNWTVTVHLAGYDGETDATEEEREVIADKTYGIVALITDKSTGSVLGFKAKGIAFSSSSETRIIDLPECNTLKMYDYGWNNDWDHPHFNFDPENHNISFRLYEGTRAVDQWSSCSYSDIINSPESVTGYEFLAAPYGNIVNTENHTTRLNLKRAYDKQYAVRFKIEPAGLKVSDSDQYYLLVTAVHQTGNPTYGYGKIIINAGDSVVDVPITEWYDTNKTLLLNEKFTGNEQVSCEIYTTNKDGNGNKPGFTDFSNFKDNQVKVIVPDGSSINRYNVYLDAGHGEDPDDENKIITIYDTVKLSAPNGNISKGYIDRILDDATDFGYYTEAYESASGDIEATIGAASLSAALGDYFGYSSSNINVNRLKILKVYTNADGSPVTGKHVTIHLTQDNTVLDRSGETNEMGVLELEFEGLNSGIYNISEEIDGVIISENGQAIVDGTTLSVNFSKNKAVFSNNKNLNYFGTIEYTNDGDRALMLNYATRVDAVILTDSTEEVERLTNIRNNNSYYSKATGLTILQNGTEGYKHYDIINDMVKLRKLSDDLASAQSSSTIRVINLTASQMSLNGTKLDDDGRYIVLNITMDCDTFCPTVILDGQELQADYGQSGKQNSSKVLYNLRSTSGGLYDGNVNTSKIGAGIVLAPSANACYLEGLYGGTIIAKRVNRSGNELHSNNPNQIQTLNITITNTVGDAQTGLLNLSKGFSDPSIKDKQTYFTFEVSLFNDDPSKVNGQTFLASGLKGGASSVTFNDEGKAIILVCAQNSVTIANLPAGTTYTVKEINSSETEHFKLDYYETDDNDHVTTASVSGTITANQTASVRAMNKLDSGTNVDFRANKSLTGGELSAGSFEFTLEEYDSTFTEKNEGFSVQTKSNDATGNVIFDRISYDVTGEHYYLIKEVIPVDADDTNGDVTKLTEAGLIHYDTKEYKYHVSITIVNNELKLASYRIEDGTETADSQLCASFTNRIDKTTVTLTGTKTLIGRDMNENETFEFSVTENVNDTDTEVARGVAKGGTDEVATPITFTPIEYTYDQEASYPQTHTYTVSEDTSSLADGVTHDPVQTYTVTVVVSLENVDGKQRLVAGEPSYSPEGIAFINTWEEQKIGFTVTKEWYGADGTDLYSPRTITFNVTKDGQPFAIESEHIEQTNAGAECGLFTVDNNTVILTAGVSAWPIVKIKDVSAGEYLVTETVHTGENTGSDETTQYKLNSGTYADSPIAITANNDALVIKNTEYDGSTGLQVTKKWVAADGETDISSAVSQTTIHFVVKIWKSGNYAYLTQANISGTQEKNNNLADAKQYSITRQEDGTWPVVSIDDLPENPWGWGAPYEFEIAEIEQDGSGVWHEVTANVAYVKNATKLKKFDKDATGLITIINTLDATGIQVVKKWVGKEAGPVSVELWRTQDESANTLTPVKVRLNSNEPVVVGHASTGDTVSITLKKIYRADWNSEWYSEIVAKYWDTVSNPYYYHYEPVTCIENANGFCSFSVPDAPDILIQINEYNNPELVSYTVSIPSHQQTAEPGSGEIVDGITNPVSLSQSNDWFYEWTGLEAGYNYYVKESDVTGYITTYSNNDGIKKGIITITNTRTETPKGSVRVTKAFAGLESGQYPADFQITNNVNETVFGLNTDDGKVAPSGGDGTTGNPYYWDLDDLDLGTVVTFTESGVDVPDYSLTAEANGSTLADIPYTATATADETPGVADFVNTYVRITGNLIITKTLAGKDTDAAPTGSYTYPVHVTTVIDGTTYYVMLNGTTNVYELTTTETELEVTNGTELQITGLPVSKDGTALTYTVAEVEPNSVEVTGYTNVQVEGTTVQSVEEIEITSGTPGQANLVNVYERDRGELYIQKSVTVNNEETNEENQDQVDGTYSFTVTSDDGVEPATTKVLTITISGGTVTEVDGDAILEEGKAKISGLPTGDYTVTENLTEDQITAGITFTASDYEHITVDADEGTAIPTAAFVNNINRTRIPVQKVWAFADPSGAKPERISEENAAEWPKDVSVTVILYRQVGAANPEPTEQTISLSKSNPSDAFVNLPTQLGGEAIVYSVIEDSISGVDAEKFSSAISGDATVGYTITNTEKEASLIITKTIVDTENLLSSEQKNGITFTVTGDGISEPLTKTYEEMNGGSWTLSQADGIKAGATYTVTESHADFENISRTTTVTANGQPISPVETVSEETVTITSSVTVDAGTTVGTIAFTNTYARKRGKVQVTKSFSGLDALPDDFVITAVWEGQPGIELKVKGDLPIIEGLTITRNDGVGTAKDPYIWTIDGLPVNTEVRFTETGYGAAGYNWTGKVNGSDPGEDGMTAMAVVAEVEEGETVPGVDFANDYNAGVLLPATGGPGTLIYTLGGLALILLAGVLLVSRRRGKA